MNEEKKEIRNKARKEQSSSDKTSVQPRGKCTISSCKSKREHRNEHTTYIRFIDLFGGIGGFHLGLKQANDNRSIAYEKGRKTKNIQNYSTDIKSKGLQRTPFSCVWYCDIDKYAVDTYNKNFQTNYKPTDIRTIKAEDIPDHDMLCVGFPCQSFSIAGKRKGFQDTRGTLFFEICRIAQAKKPRMLFLENVKGLLSHDEGRTFATILSSLDELGYGVEWQVLNSKNFGVPQNRERVFIIGHLRGSGSRQVFPLRESNEIFNRKNGEKRKRTQRIQSEVSPTIDARYGSLRNAGEPYILHNIYGGFGESEPRVFENFSPTIRTPKGGGHLPVVMHSLHHHRTGEYGNGIKEEESFTLDSSSGRDLVVANTVTPDAYLTKGERKRIDGKAVLTSMHERRIRRLTPVECEFLQSIPKNWTKEGIDEKGENVLVSDTQRYKMCGNAVTTNVIESIGLRIIEVINNL